VSPGGTTDIEAIGQLHLRLVRCRLRCAGESTYQTLGTLYPTARHIEEDNMRRFWSSGAVLGGAVLTFLVGQTDAALADEPTRQVVTLHRDVPRFVACAYGPLSASLDLTREITTYSKDGIPVRRTIHGYGTGSITNPVTGETLEAFVNRVFVLDLTDGAAGFTVGYNTRVPLPTGGTAIIGGGQMVLDTSGSVVDTHGPDTPSEISQVCEALAP
jgi:hypothetical protein